MKSLTIVIPFFLILTYSCSKEKRLSNFLEGTWTVIPVNDSSSVLLQFTFQECGNADNCDGSYFFDSPYSSGTYEIEWWLDNEILTISNTSGHESYNIIEWEDDYMKWRSLSNPYDSLLELERLTF
ncbi:MAG: hypothetical protein H7X71_00040 [Chitinophagales bacterium]|nr:hypothetical protein [Chitinophagales bacterium]